MMEEYFLLLKTGQSEMRAFENLNAAQKNGIIPIIELTRGKKNHPKTIARTKITYNFSAVTQFVERTVESGHRCFLDVTREPSLVAPHTEELRSERNGYSAWVDFIRERQGENPGICPVLQINPSDGLSWGDYRDSLTRQFDALSPTSDAIAYRAIKKADSSFDLDFEILADRISAFSEEGKNFYLILDFDYIRPGTGDLHAVEAAGILGVINDICPKVVPILVSTSFPQSVTDVGDDDEGDFSQEEVVFHASTAKLLHNRISVLYGDYGSINPIRNDIIMGKNGWRPRIDYPYGGSRLFYYREKRLSEGKGDEKKFLTSYSSHYRNVARKVVSDRKFTGDPISKDPESWGVNSIKLAASGSVPGSSPSYWISVRMNIHIQQQSHRLGNYLQSSDLPAFE